jgi:tripartite-type tricarboxylate transporter receptor subunit TctC
MPLKTLLATVCIAAVTASSAVAQDFPTKPVSLVMPYSAGGPGDTLSRIVGQGLTKVFGKQFIIENAAGAGGTIGSTKVANAKPDGHTLLMIHISHATNPALYPKLTYDPVNSFEPVGIVADLPMAFVAKKDFPAKDFQEFLAYVKANKDKVNYGHAGTGSASHLCGLLFFSAIETPVTTVPYKGTGPAMNDLMGGQIDFMCDQSLSVVSPVKAGRVKAYAVTSKSKVDALPDLPTVDASGVPGFEVSIWYGLFAPKGTPKPVIDKLVTGLNEALKDPEVKAKLADLGAVAAPPEKAQPEALRALLRSEIDKWTPIIKKAGVYAE